MEVTVALGKWAGGVGLVRSAVPASRAVILRAAVRPFFIRDRGAALVARRLAGPALVRFSTFLWPGEEWADVLGCAVKFGAGEGQAVPPGAREQDLLFASVRSPWTAVPAAFTTRRHDFLDNDYYAPLTFFIPEIGRVKLRLVSRHRAPPGADRVDRLRRAVDAGRASLQLEYRGLGVRRSWRPVVQLGLVALTDMDARSVPFSFFRAGRGIEPRGLLGALSWTSQAARRRILRPRASPPLRPASDAVVSSAEPS